MYGAVPVFSQKLRFVTTVAPFSYISDLNLYPLHATKLCYISDGDFPKTLGITIKKKQKNAPDDSVPTMEFDYNDDDYFR